MKAYIVTTVIGTFAVDDQNRVLLHKTFPRNPAEIAGRLKLAETRLISEEKVACDELKAKGYDTIVFDKKKEGVETVEPGNRAEGFIRGNLFDLAMKNGLVRDRMGFNHLLTRVNVEMTKVEIKKAMKKDAIVAQVIGSIEELEKSTNIFVERLREWYGLHFPEMDRVIGGHEKFVKLVAMFGNRDKIDEKELRDMAGRSIGMDLTDVDIVAIQNFATEIGKMYELKGSLQKYLDGILREVAPNFTELAGTNIAAKLIAKAGGLDRLAKMTSNTIQLLGSEKALFRFLHSKSRTGSPKYGLIFSHPLIQNAPIEKRGKIARVLASKLSMAAKIDFFSKEDKSKELKRDLDEKVREVLSARESEASHESGKNKV